MTEEKKDEYLSSGKVDNVRIAEDVVASITGIATSEVEGVASLSGGIAGNIAGLIGKRKSSSGVKVTYDEGKIMLDIYITVKYGYIITDVAKKVQEKTVNAVESMTGLEVSEADVTVTGIAFSKEKKSAVE